MIDIAKPVWHITFLTPINKNRAREGDLTQKKCFFVCFRIRSFAFLAGRDMALCDCVYSTITPDQSHMRISHNN